MTPVPGSFVSVSSRRRAPSSVPSATTTTPAWIDFPIPTPPPLQAVVVGERLGHRAVGRRDVARIPGERRPAERPLALAEERPDVRRNEPGIGERVGEAALDRLAAEVVAVIEDLGAVALHL